MFIFLRPQKTTAALTSGGGGYKNIMKITTPLRRVWV